MDLCTLTYLLAFVLLFLGFAFLVFWLRGGNGKWRWKYLSREEKLVSMDQNSPIYGLMSLVALALGGWFVALAVNGVGKLPEDVIFFGRILVTVPVILLLTTVGIIRQPWHHKKNR
jgi:hypothetical protein